MIQEIVVEEKKHLIFIHANPQMSEVVIRLTKPNANVVVDEIFLSQSESKIKIVHESPSTISRIYTRGIVNKNEFSKAHATVIIPKNAVNSDSFVSQKFMLLHESAKIDAIPSLEIEADEVKAAHAATIHPLDEKSLLYAESRGLSRGDAQKLLIEGFLKIPQGDSNADSQ